MFTLWLLLYHSGAQNKTQSLHPWYEIYDIKFKYLHHSDTHASSHSHQYEGYQNQNKIKLKKEYIKQKLKNMQDILRPYLQYKCFWVKKN